MKRSEKLHDFHEHECGRGFMYDLECSCWDGPRVTEVDLIERAEGLEPKARYGPMRVGKAHLVDTPPD
jgi:hypothetical protein